MQNLICICSLRCDLHEKPRPKTCRPAKKPKVITCQPKARKVQTVTATRTAAAAHPHLRDTPPCPLVGPEKEALQGQLRQAAISRLVIKVS